MTYDSGDRKVRGFGTTMYARGDEPVQPHTSLAGSEYTLGGPADCAPAK